MKAFDTSDTDFDLLLSGYDLRKVLEVKKPNHGNVQTVRFITTDSGCFVFKLYSQRSADSVAFEIETLEFLNSSGFKCPEPMQDKSGKAINFTLQMPFVVYRYIEGENSPVLNEDMKMQLAEHVARLHLATECFKPVNHSHRWNYGVDFCREHAIKLATTSGNPDIKSKLAWYQDELGQISLPESLSKGICHCDFDPSNILWNNGRLVCLIDYDVACHSCFILDLAFLLNPFIPEFEWDTWDKLDKGFKAIDLTACARTVQAYMDTRSLSVDEKRHMFDALKLTVLIDCLWFFDRGSSEMFYEKSKMEKLNEYGKSRFNEDIFGKQV